MTFKSTIGFVLGATAASAVGALALFLGYGTADRLASGWAAKGFFAMALPGIVGGAWLAREHGRSASRFLAALATGFVTRLVLAALAAFFAARAGDGAGTALLSGLAAGFVPLMVFEMTWFARSRGVTGLKTEPRA